MSSHHDRKCRPVFYNCDKSLSDDSEIRDPFKSSDNESDADYHPPKKARAEGKLDATPSNVMKQHFKRSKKLSPQERLKRLKQKFKNQTQTFIGKISSNKKTAAHSSNQIETTSQNIENSDIENKSGTANGLESQESESPVRAGPYFRSYDFIFDAEDANKSSSNVTSNERGIDNRRESLKAETFVEPSSSFANHDLPFDAEDVSQGCGVKNGSDNAVLNLVLGLRDGMYEMMNNFKLLSKQVSRIEMKTLRGPAFNNCEYEMSIEPELLLNFDDSLAKEGLPITTCVGLNEFEVKLREDRKYREKLVRFVIFIDYFIPFPSLLT